MRLSFAPMEGVTNAVYRGVHAEMFPGADVYYAPFLAPDGEGRCRLSTLRELLPERSGGVRLIPQLLVNRSAPFLSLARQLAELGYTEINLNLGCPSGTVVAKHKGAGMLADPAALDRCLGEIFEAAPTAVSVKTRLGFASTAEFPALLAVYRKYPLARLIVHARDRAGLYRSRPDRERFAEALADNPFPVEYNGDLFAPEDVEGLARQYPTLDGAMLGRGAVCNPALFRQLRGGSALTAAELRAFHDALLERSLADGLPPPYAAARMKELWYYQRCLFPDASREIKAVVKSRTLPEYRAAVSALFSACRFDPSARFTQA